MHTHTTQRSIRRRPFQVQYSTLPTYSGEDLKSSGKKHIPETLRHVMRNLPSSVVVLTTSATVPDSRGGAVQQSPERFYRGMALSSFTTLSLSPPLITFNIRAPSRTLSAIKQSSVFLIHVLEANREGASVADSFTKGNADGVEVGEAFRARCGSLQVENIIFKTQSWVSGTETGTGLGLPKLVGKGVKRVLGCELYKSLPTMDQGISDGLIEVGEHVLVVAKVTSIFPKEAMEQMDDPVQYGLSYVDGRYRTVGQTIMAHDTKNDAEREIHGAV
jgi:flavin reductase (DIM6/NTAB) family NADH-FMN oxidoreductase RutF